MLDAGRPEPEGAHAPPRRRRGPLLFCEAEDGLRALELSAERSFDLEEARYVEGTAEERLAPAHREGREVFLIEVLDGEASRALRDALFPEPVPLHTLDEAELRRRIVGQEGWSVAECAGSTSSGDLRFLECRGAGPQGEGFLVSVEVHDDDDDWVEWELSGGQGIADARDPRGVVYVSVADRESAGALRDRLVAVIEAVDPE